MYFGAKSYTLLPWLLVVVIVAFGKFPPVPATTTTTITEIKKSLLIRQCENKQGDNFSQQAIRRAKKRNNRQWKIQTKQWLTISGFWRRD